MAQPDEGRESDELVEPLFAGLRDADAKAADPAGSGEPAADPWRHAPRPLAAARVQAADAEPSLAPLVLKGLLVMALLIAVSAGVYFVFGV